MELHLRLLGHRFVNLTCTGEGSKGSGSPLGLQGRLAQLEERLVCNQKAGGSNPPASTPLRESEPPVRWTAPNHAVRVQTPRPLQPLGLNRSFRGDPRGHFERPFKGQSLSVVGNQFSVMLLQCPDFIPEHHGDVLEGVPVGQVAHGKGVPITVRRKRLDRLSVEAR